MHNLEPRVAPIRAAEWRFGAVDIVPVAIRLFGYAWKLV